MAFELFLWKCELVICFFLFSFLWCVLKNVWRRQTSSSWVKVLLRSGYCHNITSFNVLPEESAQYSLRSTFENRTLLSAIEHRIHESLRRFERRQSYDLLAAKEKNSFLYRVLSNILSTGSSFSLSSICHVGNNISHLVTHVPTITATSSFNEGQEENTRVSCFPDIYLVLLSTTFLANSPRFWILICRTFTNFDIYHDDTSQDSGFRRKKGWKIGWVKTALSLSAC